MPGIDSYVKLMLHLNGTDGSTTITDDSGVSKTVTCAGTAQLDTAQSKFGGASAVFDGNGDYLTSADHADWDLPGDFTIDFWVRFNSIPTASYLFGNIDLLNGSMGFGVVYNSNNTLGVFANYSGGSWAIATSKAWTASTNTWYHVAVVRSGSTITIYIDGTSIGTITSSASISSPNALTIGRNLGAGYDNSMNGWIDEFRWSKGIARWTANFTPPTEEYNSITTDMKKIAGVAYASVKKVGGVAIADIKKLARVA